jgi:2-oxoisovalerate dehydrogenase E1 component
LDENPQISASVLDLRTLLPLDKEAIFDVVKNTGKVLILHEDTLTGGIASEISSIINENCFEYLDAPVVRLASMDTPIPFAPVLEQNFLPYNKLGSVLKTLISY